MGGAAPLQGGRGGLNSKRVWQKNILVERWCKMDVKNECKCCTNIIFNSCCCFWSRPCLKTKCLSHFFFFFLGGRVLKFAMSQWEGGSNRKNLGTADIRNGVLYICRFSSSFFKTLSTACLRQECCSFIPSLEAYWGFVLPSCQQQR